MGFFVDEKKAIEMLKYPRAWERTCENCAFYLNSDKKENEKYHNHCMKGFPQVLGSLPIPYYSCGDEFNWKEGEAK